MLSCTTKYFGIFNCRSNISIYFELAQLLMCELYKFWTNEKMADFREGQQ